MCFKNMMYGPEAPMPAGQPAPGHSTTHQVAPQQPIYNGTMEQQQYTYQQQQQQLNADVMQEIEEVLFADGCGVDNGNVLPPPQAYQPQYLDEHRTSPMSVSSDCTSPNDIHGMSRTPRYQHHRAQPYKTFGNRAAVFTGLARPPEYQPYNGNGYHLPPSYFYSQNVVDHLGQDQYSPGQDLDIKSAQFAVSPATSLELGGSLHSQSMCKVCGDTASGNHFGVLSCEACKSFFRRSIRSGARYACRASRGCAIEKHTRNRCQFCRLQKCVQMGMRKEAVQEERAPPVTKMPQRAGTPTQLGFSGANFPSSAATPLQPPPSLHPSLRNLDGPMSPIVSNLMHSRMFGSLPNMKMGVDQEKLSSINSSISMMLPSDSDSRPQTPLNPDMYTMGGALSSQLSASVLVNAEVQTDVPPENIQAKEGVKLDDVFEGARQSLLGIIEWSKRIPAFTSLSLDDQVKLLKTSWCQHVLLKLATRIGPRSDTVLLSSGVTCRKDQIEDPEIRRIVDHLSNEISYWLDVLHVDRVELACIKGIILFDPDARGLSSGSRKRVEIFQEQILTALESRCRTVYPVTPLRFSKLLLRLPPLKTAALEATQHMEVQRTLGNAKIDNIFGELLDFD